MDPEAFKTKSKFKVGDRVRAYHGKDVFIGEITHGRLINGELKGCFWVDNKSGGKGAWVHPQQLRRLKKRVAREWVGAWEEIGQSVMSANGVITNTRTLGFRPHSSVGIATGPAKLREVLK